MHNYETNIAKSGSFTIKYKSKKQERYNGSSICIYTKYWNTGENNWWRKLWSPKDLKGSEKLPEELEYEGWLIKTGTKKYYISISTPETAKIKAPSKTIVIDPGLRTFVTGLDIENNTIVEIGTELTKKLSRMLHVNKTLQKRINEKEEKGFKLNHQKRHNLKKAWKRGLEKIRNKVDDLHKQTAKYLCKNYDKIIIPKLNFHNLGKLNKKSKTVAGIIGQCSFVERLKTKSKQYENTKVFVVTEEYTT